MKQNISNVLTFLALLVAGVTLYTQNIQHKPVIDIQTISEDKLTNLPSVKGLNASYQYNGKNVTSLWKLHYFISNTGDESIIGDGAKKNIITDSISLKISSKFKILEANNSSSIFSIEPTDNSIELSFLQWKPQEGFNLILYVEQLEAHSEKPSLTINSREIINGEVKFSRLQDSPESTVLFKKLPKTIQSMLYWVGLLVYGIFVIAIPIVWLIDILKSIKYKTWEKSNLINYKNYTSEMIKTGKLAEYTEPNELPAHLWDAFDGSKPQFADKGLPPNAIGLIFMEAILLIPLLLLITI